MITREEAYVTQWQNAEISAAITLPSDFAEAAAELFAVRNGREEKAKKGLQSEESSKSSLSAKT